MAEDKNTMISLLKDKAKENKSLSKKLTKLEEKYVELHKQQKALIQDRETFIAFLHLVFPQQHLDELLLPDDQYGLYDIEHKLKYIQFLLIMLFMNNFQFIRSFWTLLKSQNENESGHIIEVMKEEKQMLYQKISQYEKALADKEEVKRKVIELEAQIDKLMEDLTQSTSIIFTINQQIYILFIVLTSLITQKDEQIIQLEEKVKQSEQSNERVKELEREYSELKASQLMSMFGAGKTGTSANTKNSEKQIETLKLQLSEKTNEILRIRDDNEQLRSQIEQLQEQLQQQELSHQQQQIEQASQSQNQIQPVLIPQNDILPTNKPASLQNANNNFNQINAPSINNSMMIEHSLELEDPKYRMMEQTLRDKDEEMEKLQIHNQELDMKLQKLLSEFSQFRAKAHLMLTQKEDEIDKLRGRKSQESQSKNSQITSTNNQANYDLDSGYESSVSTTVRNQQDLERDKIKETLNIDYVKNVFIKYLEYQANSNEKEAMTMEKVLFTVLKATDKDIEIIERARQKNTGGLLSYFYSSASSVVPRPVQPRIIDESPDSLRKSVSFNSDNAFMAKKQVGGGGIPLNEFIQDKQTISAQQQKIDVTVKNDNRKYFNINFSN